MPIRLRLTLWYLSTLFVLLLLFAAYFVSQAYFTLLQQTDNTLALAAGQAITQVQLSPEPIFADEFALRKAMYAIDNDLTVMIVGADGKSFQQITHAPFLHDEFFFGEQFSGEQFLEHSDSEQNDLEHNDLEHNEENGAGLGQIFRRFDFGWTEESISDVESFTVDEFELLDEERLSDELIIAEILPTVVPFESFETVEMEGTRWRFYSQPVPDSDSDETWIQVAQSLELLDSFWNDVTTQMLWAIPLALLLAGLIGHWMAQRALSPIAQMTATAQEISGHDLSRRIDYRGATDEVGQLAQTMDSMLERLQNAFDRERRFTGDAAHELRTPLTALKGKIDVTLSRERGPDEYAAAVSSMGDQVDRLIRLSSDLLFMARFDQQETNGTTVAKINIAELIHAVVDQIRPLGDQKQIQITQSAAPALTIVGDMDLLIRLFLNLLDNAIKYTPDGGSVSILAQHSSDGVQIQIRDTGIGIPEADLPHLFTRFYRVEQDRARHDTASSGSGLGLAIAQEIVQVHNGTIRAASAPKQGTTMTVCFPIPIL